MKLLESKLFVMTFNLGKMEKNNTINVLIVVLCVLLVGFVYINSKMMDEFNEHKTTEKIKLENQRVPMK